MVERVVNNTLINHKYPLYLLFLSSWAFHIAYC
jgi:hypothetical protein